MEVNPNNGSYRESRSSPFSHPRMVSFQSSAIDSSTGMARGDVPTLAGNNSMVSILMTAGFGMSNHMDAATQAQYSAESVFQEMMPWFRHVSGSPAYWSPDKNKENGKRRKTEEYYATKKIKDMKEKMMGFPSTNTSVAPNLLTMHHMSIHDQLPSEELKSFLEKNEKCLKEIARNLEGGMMRDNISLFHYMRNNIATLENRITILSRGMNQHPRSLRRIPPMPVTVNDGLLSSLAPLNEHGLAQLVNAKGFAPNKAGVNSQRFYHLGLSTDLLLCMRQLDP